MRTRVICVGMIKNEEGKYLLCRMAKDHGVYPGLWGLVGGGKEENETLEEAMKREIAEEVGLEVRSLQPLFFSEDQRTKIFRDGTSEEQYLIFLNFEVAVSGTVKLNEEWEEFAWVQLDEVGRYELNVKTIESFERYGKFIGKRNQ